ncbi:hypothetical protein [Mycolicibacterium fluoranthenivorans]|uniref:hypothetical protein n=1 Tax=Mycolicibacterium fluoranthenivorans TaxID=258505 RepID=UPI001F3EFA7A|nr:hypothetical protein [Mycolicibacterium fluoranthenivorans]
MKLLRDYLAEHPRADAPKAPRFPGMRLSAIKPAGVAHIDPEPAEDLAGNGDTEHVSRLVPKTGARSPIARQPRSVR